MAEAQHMHRPCARMDSRQCGGGAPQQSRERCWSGGEVTGTGSDARCSDELPDRVRRGPRQGVSVTAGPQTASGAREEAGSGRQGPR